MDDVELADLVGRAVVWRDGDPDPRTRREIDHLIERLQVGGRETRLAAADALDDRFCAELSFGTAGLRGALGAGPNRMNRAVVIRAAAGLAEHLLTTVPGPDDEAADAGADRPDAADAAAGDPPVVVVGYDARTDSDVFAIDTCAVLTAAGCRALLLPRELPTPVLAFAVRHLNADAGVMVTASHNPPQDNGYKVYLGGRADCSAGQGAQIVPPHDRLIAAHISAAPAALAVPMETSGWTTLGEDVVDAYLLAIAGLVRGHSGAPVEIVLTPLHGVGAEIAVKAFSTAGFAVPHVVPEQAAPDPTFPTVAFPNPEEPGAMDLAIAAARARGAELVIANDPDADRCAVAVPDPQQAGARGWRMLRGDEVGALLGDHLLPLDAGIDAGIDAGRTGGPPLTVASSIVSSQLLARIAESRGHRHEETLTGFKWLSRVPGLSYAYEEALGYCVAPDVVRDKDGISAALLVAALAEELKARGRTLLDALDDLALAHGLHATDQFSVRVDDIAQIPAMVDRLRAVPPTRLGDSEVISAVDLATGVDGLPPTEGLRYRTSAGGRVIVRPSGTEPKLKIYLEVVVPVAERSGLPAARELAAGALAALGRDVTTSLGLVPTHP